MVGEFIQVFTLLLAISVMLLLFFMLTVKRDKLSMPLAVFLVLLAFLSLAMSYLSARVYVPLPVNGTNGTAVKYYQDPYGIGFLSIVMSLISIFLAVTVVFIALANQGIRSFGP